MSIDPIENARIEPDRQLPSADLRRLYKENPREALKLVYGDRHPEDFSYLGKHDHSEQGGELLSGISVTSLSFGLYRRGEGSDNAPGIPIQEVDAGFSGDLTVTPKLIGVFPLRIPGGVTGLRVRLLFTHDINSGSKQNFTLLLVLRPLSFVNFNDFSSSISESDFLFGHLKRLSTSIFFANVLFQSTVDFSDISRLGASVRNRNAELCVFQASEITPTNTVFLTGLTSLVLSNTNDVRPLEPGDTEDHRVSLAEIATGSRLSDGLASKAKAVTQNLSKAILGEAPGYENGQVTLQRTWKQDLFEAHQHTGIEILKDDGTFESDGALLPCQLFTQTFSINQREISSGEIVDDEPVEGPKIHSGGTLGATWRRYSARLSLGAGTQKIKILIALRPEIAATQNRCFFYAHLRPVGEARTATNTKLVSLGHEGIGSVSSTFDSEGFVFGEILPQETPGYQPNTTLVNQGRGLWSQLAIENNLPDGVRLEKSYRVSEEIVLQVDRTTPFKTQDYTLEYRVALDTAGNQSSFDTGAYILWTIGYY